MTTNLPTRRKSDRSDRRLHLTLAFLAVAAWGTVAFVAYEAHAKTRAALSIRANG